ncbi:MULTISPECIES: hypothetical protein [unclassified Microbacterium]|uniref:hypothetical protein n=1 Tax=unclassified Microbacterium TaxID=2609290 RepID=UPI00301823D2
MSDPNSTHPDDATTEAAASAAGRAADPDSTEQPSTDELAEPSTEKEPGEEPTAPDGGDTTAGTDEPSHEATGIGVLGVDDE